MKGWGLALAATLLAAPAVALADPCEGALPAPGARFDGPVRYVGDGDSLCVGRSSDPSTWIEVRVSDFYAPELNSPGGRAAKTMLEDVVWRQTHHGRLLERIFSRDREELVYRPMVLDAPDAFERQRAQGRRVPAAPPAALE